MKISMIAYFSHGYLCRRRHKVALIVESNLKFDPRFLRRKESSVEWRLICRRREVGSDVLFMETMADNR